MAELEDLEINDYIELNKSLSDLLEKTAIAIRGQQPENTLFSFHDIPDRAAACISLIGLQANIINEQAKELESLRELLLHEIAPFIQELPGDLGRGSLNGFRHQIAQKLSDTLK